MSTNQIIQKRRSENEYNERKSLWDKQKDVYY